MNNMKDHLLWMIPVSPIILILKGGVVGLILLWGWWILTCMYKTAQLNNDPEYQAKLRREQKYKEEWEKHLEKFPELKDPSYYDWGNEAKGREVEKRMSDYYKNKKNE